MVKGLPNVVGAPVVDPETEFPALFGNLRGVAGPRQRRGDETRPPGRCRKPAVAVHPGRTGNDAVDDPGRRLDAVAPAPAQEIVCDAGIGLHGIVAGALELVAGVDENVFGRAPVEIEKSVSHQRVVVIQVQFPDAAGETGHDRPVGNGLARRVHETFVKAQAAFAVDRRQLAFPPLRRRQHQVRVLRRRRHVDVLGLSGTCRLPSAPRRCALPVRPRGGPGWRRWRP